MLKSVLWLSTVLIIFNTSGQNPSITVNGVDLSNSESCGFYPNSIGYSFSNSAITISKGSYSLVRNRRVIQVVAIDSLFNTESLNAMMSFIKPNDRLLIDVSEMTLGSKTLSCKISRVIRFELDLIPVLDSSLDLIINNSVIYKKTGLVVDSIFSIQVVSSIGNDFTINVTHARGNRLVKNRIVSVGVLKKELFKYGKPGDRFILEIISKTSERKKIIIVPITD